MVRVNSAIGHAFTPNQRGRPPQRAPNVSSTPIVVGARTPCQEPPSPAGTRAEAVASGSLPIAYAGPVRQLPSGVFASGALGVVFYGFLFLGLAWFATRTVRSLVEGAIRRDSRGLIDRTAARFFVQFARAAIYLVALTAYFHAIPELRALGTFLLAGVSVASVVFGLAASSALSNLIAGMTLLIYFPYRVGDSLRLPVAGSTETAAIESINLGYTQLRSPTGETLVIPNSVMISTAVALVDRARATATTEIPGGRG